MSKKNLLLILVLSLIFSCKNDKKSTDYPSDTSNEESKEKSFQDKEIEDALYNGYFIKNENGYDVAIFNNTLYLLKANPSEDFKNNHFFMHLIPKNGAIINLDFSPSEYRINDQLSAAFSNVWVYKRELQELKVPFDINIGQFNDQSRSWSTYLMLDGINHTDNKYNNEYLAFTKNNRYLKDFESAFNDGYFMKHEEGFDLLLHGHTLYYIKTNGNDSDLKDMFFLHVKYDNKEETHNLDFKGESFQINKLLGNRFKNFMVVKREIPNKGKVTEIDTGQFDKDTRSWSVLYNIEELYDNMNFIYNDQYQTVIQAKTD